MDNIDGVSQYRIRGLAIWGFRDQQQCVDYLFDGHRVKTGCLVAMNAEKVLKAERDPALMALLNEAEIKYADGISIVRSIRRKYPSARLSRVAGADLWEGIMERAVKKVRRYSLSAAKRRCWSKPRQKHAPDGTSPLSVARTVILPPANRPPFSAGYGRAARPL